MIWHCFMGWTAFTVSLRRVWDFKSKVFLFFFLSDLGYQSVDAYQTLVVTVWIPFVDSNEQNGCLQVKKSTFYNVL